MNLGNVGQSVVRYITRYRKKFAQEGLETSECLCSKKSAQTTNIFNHHYHFNTIKRDAHFLKLMVISFFRIMKVLELSQVGRYHYDPKRPGPIPQHRLELWPGYITDIQASENNNVIKIVS